MSNYLPMNLSDVCDLPNQKYFLDIPKSKDFRNSVTMQYMRGRFYAERQDLIRHYLINDIPMYMLSVHQGDPNPRWIRDPFLLMEECLSQVASISVDGTTCSLVEFHNVSDLNELHRSYDDDGNETVHDYTSWEHHFGGLYLGTARDIYSGFSKEDQERLLPKESIHILTKPLD